MGYHNFPDIRTCGTFTFNLSFCDLIFIIYLFIYFLPAAISVPFLSLFM
jgi:hypothetical protein